jgi:hypothetical protein
MTRAPRHKPPLRSLPSSAQAKYLTAKSNDAKAGPSAAGQTLRACISAGWVTLVGARYEITPLGRNALAAWREAQGER